MLRYQYRDEGLLLRGKLRPEFLVESVNLSIKWRSYDPIIPVVEKYHRDIANRSEDRIDIPHQGAEVGVFAVASFAQERVHPGTEVQTSGRIPRLHGEPSVRLGVVQPEAEGVSESHSS